MHLPNYLGLVHESEKDLAKAFRSVAKHHGAEPDVEQMCQKLAAWSEDHLSQLKKFISRYSEHKSSEPDDLKKTLFSQPRSGSLALLRDLHDLWLLANEVQLCWIVIQQASKSLRDKELETSCLEFDSQTQKQIDWLLSRIKQAAPQALVVAE